MSENLRNYVKAMYAFDAVVQRVPESAWDNASPCDGWTAREVAGHTIWGAQRWVSGCTDAPPPAEQPEAEVAGANPAATWSAVSDALLAALDTEGVLTKVMDGPFGPMPINAALGIFFADPLLHSWDIAQATGVQAHLPADLAAIAATNLAAAGEGIRGPGMFGPAVDGDSTDPAAELLRVSGRTPA